MANTIVWGDILGVSIVLQLDTEADVTIVSNADLAYKYGKLILHPTSIWLGLLMTNDSPLQCLGKMSTSIGINHNTLRVLLCAILLKLSNLCWELSGLMCFSFGTRSPPIIGFHHC